MRLLVHLCYRCCHFLWIVSEVCAVQQQQITAKVVVQFDKTIVVRVTKQEVVRRTHLLRLTGLEK